MKRAIKSQVLRDEVHVYSNILLDDSLKFEFFKTSFEMWHDVLQLDFTVRVRGNFADDAIDFLHKYQNVNCFRGMDFRLWRTQVYKDLEAINSSHIFLLLEDHVPARTSRAYYRSVLDDLIRSNVDIFQYSWFPRYREYSSRYAKFGFEIMSSIKLFTLTKSQQNYLEREEFVVALTSIFKRSLLLRLLESRRPLIKHFEPKAPFNVEINPKADWYLPLIFAVPTLEFGMCIDDDHGFPGSSAISRGLLHFDRPKRGETHFGTNSFFKIAKNVFLNQFPTLFRRNSTILGVLAGLAHNVDVIKFSCTGILLQFYDFRKLYSQRSKDLES